MLTVHRPCWKLRSASRGQQMGFHFLWQQPLCRGARVRAGPCARGGGRRRGGGARSSVDCLRRFQASVSARAPLLVALTQFCPRRGPLPGHASAATQDFLGRFSTLSQGCGKTPDSTVLAPMCFGPVLCQALGWASQSGAGLNLLSWAADASFPGRSCAQKGRRGTGRGPRGTGAAMPRPLLCDHSLRLLLSRVRELILPAPGGDGV